MNNIDNSYFLKYAEAFIMSALFIAVGYIFNSQDPCFLENRINISLFFLATLTLFFGWTGLLSFIIVYSLAMKTLYTTFDVYQLLQLSILGLILYLFQYVWDTKIKKQIVKEEYLSQKLSENSSAFYTLKASYDRLEKDYITKPFSLKDSLKKIINLTTNQNRGAKSEFLKFLSQIYQVRKSMMVTYEKGEIREFYSLDKSDNFNQNDILIKRALSENIPVYIDFNDNNQSSYLAVIPVISKEREKISLLVIKDMLFSSFNKDTLLQISVIFTYFVQSLEKKRFMELHGCNRPYLDEMFAFELCKLQQIEKLYDIPSSMITIKSTNREFMKKLLSIIKKEKRVIELIQTLTVNKTNYVIIVLFPFSNTSNVEGFLSRLKSKFTYIESKDFSYKIGDIKKNKIENLLE